MKRFFALLLLIGLVLGGYNCNPSAEKKSDELSIGEPVPEYDLMEKKIIEEADQYGKQTNLPKKWKESEEDITEESLGDQIEK